MAVGIIHFRAPNFSSPCAEMLVPSTPEPPPLGDLKGLTAMTELTLVNTQVTAEGIADLKRAWPLKPDSAVFVEGP